MVWKKFDREVLKLNFREVKELYKDTLRSITSSPKNWQDYLDTASTIYRYPYDEQILIHAQNPDAKAVASMNIWNKNMGCVIKKGSKGIALIDRDSKYRSGLKYVFDISQVRELPNIGRVPKLWEMKPQYESAVIEHLENIYGKTDTSKSFSNRLIEIADKICEDTMEEVINASKMISDDFNHDDLYTLARNSLKYTLLKRCGIDTSLYDFDFTKVTDIKYDGMVTDLAKYTSDLSNPLLHEIGMCIAQVDKEIEKNRNKKIKIIPSEELEDKSFYSRPFTIRRRTKDEVGVHKERGISNTESEGQQGTGGGTVQIRRDVLGLSGGEPQLIMDASVHVGRNSQGLFDNTERSGGILSDIGSTDGSRRGINRGDEEHGSALLGSENEQHSTESGRDSDIRDYNQSEQESSVRGSRDNQEQIEEIKELFPTTEEQMGTALIYSPEIRKSFPEIKSLYLSQDDIKDVLRSGTNNEHSREHIYAQYIYGKSPEEITDFIKNEYKNFAKGFTFGDSNVSFAVDDEGIKGGLGNSAFNAPALDLSWKDIESGIRNLIESGDYIDFLTAETVIPIERNDLSYSISFFLRDCNGYNSDLFSGIHVYPEITDKISNIISTKEGITKAREEFKHISSLIESGEITSHFVSTERANQIIKKLDDMAKDPVILHPHSTVSAVKLESFITQDEVNREILRGSDFKNGKHRIYDFFSDKHSLAEKVEFLKNEYGIGGHSAQGEIDSWHDSRGIQLSKRKFEHGEELTVKLRWPEVAKRVTDLIVNDNYLTPAEKLNHSQIDKGNSVEKDEVAFTFNNGSSILIQNASDGSYDYTIYDRNYNEIDGGQYNNYSSKLNLAEDIAKDFETSIQDSISPEIIHQKIEENVQVFSKEISLVEAQNFHITNPDLGKGGNKEKYNRNIAAIKTLKQLELENRNATSEEQEILSQYVGWGGLSDAFDDSKQEWSSEFHELKELLSASEYNAAKGSTLNAHYTQPDIISGIYDVISRMGFTKGNILEPAMGVGNFFGMLPDELSESRLYGIELDSISGRIAQKLYPKSKIEIKGFEETSYPDNFFDIAVGNVPFGDYKVYDKGYNKLNFNIHDYFFAKTLDKVRPGGVIAFITSMGTMDKKGESVRRFLAERADLLGAVRLPNNAFSKNAGTQVTSDIIFLKKRDHIRSIDEKWIHTGVDSNGIEVNSYFIDHPEMILGHMDMISGPFGMKSSCIADDSVPLKDQLTKALENIDGEIGISLAETDLDFGIENKADTNVLPADPNVENYSYTIVEDKVYFREDSLMRPLDSPSKEDRIKALINVRDAVKDLISKQLNDAPEEDILKSRDLLNKIYDDCVSKFGRLASKSNQSAFSKDSSTFLLASLEKYDDGKFVGKADIFTKRTIKRTEKIHAENPIQALAASLNEKGVVDLDYMSDLIKIDKDRITSVLQGVIFKDPQTGSWVTSDEYLSGNVRQKLDIAKEAASNNPEYSINVQKLSVVQPKDLDASEIDVRLGSTWIDKKYILDFMTEVLNTPRYKLGRMINVNFSNLTGAWSIEGKNNDFNNVTINQTFGTDRINAYALLENCLNLKETVIKDRVDMPEGSRYVVNKKETILACQKQDAIKEAFKEWIYKDPDRRHELVERYNLLFNSNRPRAYDGSHLSFPGMAEDVVLRDHQKNAVAHILYGGNTLLAHCVGAGKTFEMATAAMEMKRIGICSKSLFVVPSHLTEQWGRDFLRLYPSANILVATKKDFEPANRKTFCARIATGNYDAVIIGHSQFEKIPLSKERQEMMIQKQIDEIEEAIAEAKSGNGAHFTVKQMEKSRKGLESKLKALTDIKKDDVVTFEQLGVDRLFVDESHYYKNLYLYTKMNNVAGIQSTEAQKSQDMYLKCQYMDELTGGKGITFATGTPVSNSMQELYTNMRYLQASTLQDKGLSQFDAWASTFGECSTNMEIDPTGTTFRSKTRFANFFNLPELMSMFKEAADIKTSEDLDLPVPDVEYNNIQLERSEYQDEIMQQISERTDMIKSGAVDPSEDNMLKITNDGRKLALDQRLINPMLPDHSNSKTSKCVDIAFKIYQETMDTKSTQVFFCDKSVPTYDGSFNVYDDIKQKLIAKGVPADQIAFIHDCKGNRQKEQELFTKVNKGEVRFIIGSTDKMGAGTNMQHKLIALHHLDCPWRPADLEQREGRIIRQGNENYTLNRPVKIFRYVTKDTFDAYSWQIIENKQKFISQIMTSKAPVRGYQDIDEEVISAATVKALCSGNPAIAEKMQLDVDVTKLKLAKANYQAQQYRLQDSINITYPKAIANYTNRISSLTSDIEMWKLNKPDKDSFNIVIDAKNYSDTKDAGAALIESIQKNCIGKHGEPQYIGQFAGFSLSANYDSLMNKFFLNIKGSSDRSIELSDSAIGNLTRIQNALDHMESDLNSAKHGLDDAKSNLENAKLQLGKPFGKEDELNRKIARLNELNELLNDDKEAENLSEQVIVSSEEKKERKGEKSSLIENLKRKLSAVEAEKTNVRKEQDKDMHMLVGIGDD